MVKSDLESVPCALWGCGVLAASALEGETVPHASSSFPRVLVGFCVLWAHLLMIQIVPILCAKAKVRGDVKVM